MKSDSDGVFTRTGAFANLSSADPLVPELRELIDEFGGGGAILQQCLKAAVQMQEFGLDPSSPEGQRKAAEVIRRRLKGDARIQESIRASGIKAAEREAAIQSFDGTECVYYLDLYGSMVKIGYTGHLLNRIGQLRRDRTHLLAVEPGGRATERLRHRQFREERQDGREDFARSERLLAHIDTVVATHGEPLDFLARLGRAA